MRNLFISFLLVLITFNVSYAEEFLLGVAEDPNAWGPESNTTIDPRVRILFQKDNNRWVSLDTKSKQTNLGIERVTWTIAFDGKSLGNLVTVDDMKIRFPDCSWCFPRDKFFRIEDLSQYPKLGNKEKRFWDWAKLPRNRPVVLVNAPNFRDKEQWKRFKPERSTLEQIFPILTEIVQKNGFYCKGMKTNIDMDDLALFRSYRNIQGKMLVSVGPSEKCLKKSYAPDDFGSGLLWFYFGEEVKPLGDSLDLVDVGDYDSDGEVEFLFHYSGYNLDGYSLYENDFEDRFDFRWNYH